MACQHWSQLHNSKVSNKKSNVHAINQTQSIKVIMETWTDQLHRYSSPLLFYAPMANMRSRSRPTTAAAPPPSPIPTAKGSRSASNETFTQFLDNCLQIPDLALPPSHPFAAGSTPHPVPAGIDFRSLSANSIARILSSARDFGAFRISGHGISAEELRTVVREAESVFGSGFVERNGNREEIVWVRDQGKLTESGGYRAFCKNMEKVASKVEAIAEQVIEVFIRNAEKQFEKRSEGGTEWVIKLYRYNNNEPEKSMELQNPFNILQNEKNDDHGLCLHLPLEHSLFHIQSERGPFSFDAGPESLVVTIGKQVQGFECVTGEVVFVPYIRGSQDYSFFIQLKVPFSNSSTKNQSKIVSIADQVLIAVIICLLYRIVVFIYTHYITT